MMKKEYNAMFDKLAPQKSDEDLLYAVIFGKEESSITKRKFRFKPLIISAIVMIISVVSLLTVNAATQGAVVKFFMGGENIEGEYYDYVDGEGFRHISFGATLPIYEENFAIIYNVDAPREEAVRVITDETNPEFMEKLRQYTKVQNEYWEAVEAWNADPEHNVYPGDVGPDGEDVGLVFKDSELCLYRLGYVTEDSGFNLHDGSLGGKFMYTGVAEEHPSGVGDKENPNECHYDWENETKTFRESFFYYVGKE